MYGRQRCLLAVAVASVVLFTAARGGSLPLTTDSTAAKNEDRAYWALELGRPDKAASIYESILSESPNYGDTPSVKFHLLRSYLGTSRFDEAITLAESIVAEYPNTATAAWSEVMKGDAYQCKGNETKAFQTWAQVSKYTHLNDLSPILMAVGKVGEIIVSTERARFADPKVLENLPPKSDAEKQLLAGRKVSIADVASVNGFDRTDPSTCAWVGMCWISRIFPPNVFSVYREMEAKYAGNHRELAIAAISAGQRYLAWTEEQKEPSAYAEQLAEAVRMMENVRTLTKDSPYIQVEADVILARYYERRQQWERVVSYCSHALSLPNPHCWEELSCLLGEAYLNLGRTEDAILAYAPVINGTKWTEWTSSALHGTGMALVNQGKLTEAVETFFKEAEYSKNASWRMLAAERAAQYSEQTGDVTNAVRALRLAIATLREEIGSESPRRQADWPAHASKRLEYLEVRLAQMQSIEEKGGR